MSEQIVYNIEIEDKVADIRCNWCSTYFEYKEKANEVRHNTTCPWCSQKVSVPRRRLRRERK